MYYIINYEENRVKDTIDCVFRVECRDSPDLDVASPRFKHKHISKKHNIITIKKYLDIYDI